jgi:hypothetical protein
MEEAPIAAVAAPPQVFGVLEPESEFEAEEFFSFEDESEAIEETGPALDLADTVEEPVVQPSAEELFSFAEEPPLSQGSEREPLRSGEELFNFSEEPSPTPASEPFGLAEYDGFAFEPEAVEPAAPVQAAPAEPVREPIAAFEPQSTPVFPPAVPVAAEAKAQPGAFALSESDLIAALSKISKEVIERIVWEVVPDLAEVLIKEEIRKLKAGTRG